MLEIKDKLPRSFLPFVFTEADDPGTQWLKGELCKVQRRSDRRWLLAKVVAVPALGYREVERADGFRRTYALANIRPVSKP